MLNNKNKDIYFKAVLLIGVILLIILEGFNFLRFYSLNPLSLGTGNYERIFRLVVLGIDAYNLPYVSSFPWPELLVIPLVLPASYVFYLFFLLLAGLFKLPVTFAQILLSVQPLFFLLPAVLIYKLADFIIKDKKLSFAVTFSYLASQLVFIGSTIGFIFTYIGISFLLLEFYFIFQGKAKRALFSAVLANATRVDLVIANVIFGIVLAGRGRNCRRQGYYIAAVSIVWLVALGVFVLPKVNLAVFHGSQYGASLKEALGYLIKNPAVAFNLVARVYPRLFMVYIAHCFFLPLFSPLFLLPLLSAAPVFIFRSDTANIFTHLAFIYLSAIFGVKFLMDKYAKSRFIRNFLFTGLIVSACLSHYFFHYRFIGESVGVIPFSRGFSFKSNLASERSRLGFKIIKSIPTESSCFTIAPLAQRLGHLKKVGVFNITPLEDYFDWDYYFLSTKELEYAAWKFDYSKYSEMIRDILKTRRYNVEVHKDGWLLLKKASGRLSSREDVEEVLSELF